MPEAETYTENQSVFVVTKILLAKFTISIKLFWFKVSATVLIFFPIRTLY